MQELNGKLVSMIFEIKNIVVHVGHSLHLRHFQTEFVLQAKAKSLMFTLQKILLSVTKVIMDVMVACFQQSGNILRAMVL